MFSFLCMYRLPSSLISIGNVTEDIVREDSLIPKQLAFVEQYLFAFARLECFLLDPYSKSNFPSNFT